MYNSAFKLFLSLFLSFPGDLISSVPGVTKITIYTVSKFNKMFTKRSKKLYH